MDLDEGQALRVWKITTRDAPEYAQTLVACLGQVLREPPDDLVDLMKEHGWIQLFHKPRDGSWVEYSRDEYLKWLEAMRDAFAQELIPETSQD
jgi:hypothetical protein